MPNFGEIANAARDFACTLYRNQPGALIPNPISDVINHAWDTMCGENPSPSAPALPAAPTTPFTGGQCVCAKYRITYTPTGGGFGTSQTPRSFDVYGPIRATYLVTVPAGNAVSFRVLCRGLAGGNCSPTEVEVSGAQWSNQGSPPPTYSNVSVAPLAGFPNNCGNPPPAYPPATPAPPGGFTSPATPITFNDNSVKNYYFNVKPPLVLPSPAGLIPPIVVNYLSATVNPEFNIPINFNFDGTIEFGTPSDSGGGSFTEGDRTTINNLNTTVNEIQNDFNFINFPPNYDTDPGVGKEDFPVSGGKEDTDVEGLLGVLVELTKLPDKLQMGTPRVSFAGWLAFYVQGGYTERIPVSFDRGWFPAPEGAKGYGITFTNGAEGIVTVYNKV